MSDRTVRERCVQLLRDVAVPDPFYMNAFCEDLAAQRGRPIRLIPLDGPGTIDEPCGMWCATTSVDYVFYATRTSPLHQEHIIVHELAHMICGHTTSADAALGGIGGVLADLDPDVVQRVLARSRYGAEQEREAELLATMILDHARHAPGERASVETELQATVARIEDAFG